MDSEYRDLVASSISDEEKLTSHRDLDRALGTKADAGARAARGEWRARQRRQRAVGLAPETSDRVRAGGVEIDVEEADRAATCTGGPLASGLGRGAGNGGQRRHGDRNGKRCERLSAAKAKWLGLVYSHAIPFRDLMRTIL